MESIIQEGKTVDDAVQKALARLNLPMERVKIEVLEEGSRGLLGLIAAREARVKVWLKETREERGLKFLQKVCEKMGINARIEVLKDEEEPGQVVFDISAANLGLLIGKRGQTIDALQYLTNLVANKGEGEEYLRIIIDAEGYREKRQVTLESLAERMADKAIRQQRKVILEPMAPHERRIIHMALKDHDRVVTKSEGEEPYRKIVIEPMETQ